IRTGFDFDAVKRKDCRSASEYLRSEWAFWRHTAEKYGFGRTELLPIKSTGEAVAEYVGKYIGKHIGNRLPQDKGARLVRYSRGTNRATARFSWCTPGAALWRTKLGLLCRALGLTSDNYTEKFREWYGARWSHTLAPIVESLRPLQYPSHRAMQNDYPALTPPPKYTRSDPDSNPNTGPWANPFPEEARQSQIRAWAAALDERERRQPRNNRRTDAARRTSTTGFSALRAWSPNIAWIAQTANDG
ncbi:MAG: hypothetical protein KGS61_19340, partial [Verrucomicrobia bacterium]|nr:hypothetical protein [Verrucomicrobiota bacterium]